MIIYIATVILTLWSIVLSYLVYRTKKHYNKLISISGKNNIASIFEKLIADNQIYKKEFEKIKIELSKIENTSKKYLQKIGMIRFNPFERIGGEQSFVLAILDQADSGVVINFIYTREGMRVYTKKVKTGKGVEYNLSEEEKEAIKSSSIVV